MPATEIFDRVGVDAHLHVIDVDTGREVGTRPDEQVVDGPGPDGTTAVLDPAAVRLPARRAGGRQDRHPAGLHIEAGVAEYPDGGRCAIAVFARTRRWDARRIDVDLAMGEAARQAVDTLRAM